MVTKRGASAPAVAHEVALVVAHRGDQHFLGNLEEPWIETN
jgi:hypothetical protein